MSQGGAITSLVPSLSNATPALALRAQMSSDVLPQETGSHLTEAWPTVRTHNMGKNEIKGTVWKG